MKHAPTKFLLLGLLLRLLLCAPLFVAPGCAANIPKQALNLQPDSLARRQLQTRRFDTEDELKLLQAAAMVLQDLGFAIDESETKLGVIAGSKSRDATSAQQIIGAVIVAALSGAAVPVDNVQHIKASVVTRSSQPETMNLRVTFQRTIVNTDGQVSRVESLEDPALYREFFDKLSKAVFLQANDI